MAVSLEETAALVLDAEQRPQPCPSAIFRKDRECPKKHGGNWRLLPSLLTWDSVLLLNSELDVKGSAQSSRDVEIAGPEHVWNPEGGSW